MLTRPGLGLLFGASGLMALYAPAADPPQRDLQPVELVGKASEFWYKREYREHYWREDFAFQLEEDGTGTKWQIISREPTPVDRSRLGPTYMWPKVDWNAKPRVKVVGVKGVDRVPAEFYKFKLKDPTPATALIVYVEDKPGQWQEFYVNNWFHPWGDRADLVIHGYYANKQRPYNIYGFAVGQAAPFDNQARVIIDKNKASAPLIFQGWVKRANNRFGYEIALIDLIGKDPISGDKVILHGDAKTIPSLEGTAEPAR